MDARLRRPERQRRDLRRGTGRKEPRGSSGGRGRRQRAYEIDGYQRPPAAKAKQRRPAISRERNGQQRQHDRWAAYPPEGARSWERVVLAGCGRVAAAVGAGMSVGAGAKERGGQSNSPPLPGANAAAIA